MATKPTKLTRILMDQWDRAAALVDALLKRSSMTALSPAGVIRQALDIGLTALENEVRQDVPAKRRPLASPPPVPQ